MQRREAAKRGTPSFASRSSSFPSQSEYAPSTAPSSSTRQESSYDDYRPGGAATKPSAPRGKGMQLGKKSKATDMYEHVRAEIGFDDTTPTRTPEPEPTTRTPTAASPSPYADNDGIIVSIVEAVSGQISRLGEVVNVEVRGDLQLRVADPAVSKIRLAIELEGNPASFKTHPNVDKALFSSSKVIGLKDPTRGFPSNNNPLGVLRWRLTGTGDAGAALAPLGITCWLSDSGAGTYQVTIEYELRDESAVLEDVVIFIPIASEAAEVNSGDADYSHEGDHINWNIPVISEAEASSGSFDFTVEADDENDFFPMSVSFKKTTPFAQIDVSDVVLVEGGASVEFTKEIKVETGKFEII